MRCINRGKSAERRSAMTLRAQEREFTGGGDAPRDYPCVPQGVDMTNSPGTRLRFRLPMASSPGWALFGTLAFCVLWNAGWIFLAICIGSHLIGRPNDWFLSIFSVLCVAIGVAAVVLFIRQLLLATGIGPTLMEISDHPFRPDGQYHLFLSQSGRLAINVLRVSLVCEEAATYRQGTNTRTESQPVYRQELFRREAFQIESGTPFETEFDLHVPVGAMHSFKADHNEINWVLTVEGDLSNWPSYKRSFPVIVRPANGSQQQ